MRIALLTDGIHPYVIGGMQKHSFYLAKYLALAGHQVDLYHMNQSDLDIDALSVFTAEEKKNISSFVVEFPSFGKGFGHYIRESYEYARRIYAIYQENSRPDFIYAKGFAAWEILNRKSKGEAFPPIGVNFHGYEMFQPAPSFYVSLQQKLLLKPPVRFHLQHSDYFFSYGGKITTLLEHLGIERKKILEIPTGISGDWLNSTPHVAGTTRKFVFVGRDERRKGIKELNGAIAQLNREGTAFEFHFIGPIARKNRVQAANVIYHDAIMDVEKMKQALSGMDVLVCPSFSEGMPNVIMEALASGLMVIATDVGAVGVMVAEKNGWLIPPRNQAALITALRDAVQLPPDALAAGKREAVAGVRDHFTWDRIIEQTVAAIESTIKI